MIRRFSSSNRSARPGPPDDDIFVNRAASSRPSKLDQGVSCIQRGVAWGLEAGLCAGMAVVLMVLVCVSDGQNEGGQGTSSRLGLMSQLSWSTGVPGKAPAPVRVVSCGGLLVGSKVDEHLPWNVASV